MIIILYADAKEKECEGIVSDLEKAFKGHVPISVVKASSPNVWPGDPNWDDLLVVAYDDSAFPDVGNGFIAGYLNQRKGAGLLLPVAFDPEHQTPPKAAEAIKAFLFDASSAGIDGRLVKRIGAILGLRVQQRDNRIFISYRGSDGAPIAQQLEQKLVNLGYQVWRDEAREIDGETKILPGSPVQVQIDEALEKASIVLLLDTPQAPDSRWIKHEVDTANSQLLPILPLCLRVHGDPNKGPRFRSLRDLGRFVQLVLREPLPSPPLRDDDLDRIVMEMEVYLCEIFQRKCRVPFLVEKEFVTRNFTWKLVDKRLLMGESVKEHSRRLSTRVLSHCSIFDQVHGSAMNAFREFLKKTGRPNHALYIYDGELIPEPQLEEIIAATPPEDNVVILHHQELAALIDSNFTTFV